MPNRRRPVADLNRLRRGRAGGWLAVLAMVVQLLFSIDHLSAAAAATALGVPSQTPLGVFEICHTGQENPALTNDTGNAVTPDPCPVCVLTGLSSQGLGGVAPALAPMPDAVSIAAPVIGAPVVPPGTRLRFHANRGPPLQS